MIINISKYSLYFFLCLLPSSFAYSGNATPIATESVSVCKTPVKDTGKIQNSEDQFQLGRAYYRGEGVTQSYEQAGYWYQKAADQGNLKAMYNLGNMFLDGMGTKKSERKGYELIHEAALKGDPRAKSLCGLLLCKGTGVEKNRPEGMKMLLTASQGGDPWAQSWLGQQLLVNDDGTLNDGKAALPYIQKAANAGNPWACRTMGEFYSRGLAVNKDEKQATEWFSKGAQLGDPHSQFAYGSALLAEKGPGQGYPWIKLSSDANYAAAKGLLTECMGKMSPEEIIIGDGESEKIRKNYKQ